MSLSLSPRSHDTRLRSPATGANRGIGYDLVLALLKRYPNAVLFAGARDPTSANALNELARNDSRVHVVKLIADDEESNKSAVEEVKKVTDRLDIVVANAGTLRRVPFCSSADHRNKGINTPFIPVHAESIESYKSKFHVNTFGPLYIYQATYPLLVNTRLSDSSSSLAPPKFFTTSTLVASTGSVLTSYINGPYGASKAAANHIASAIHHQTEKAGAVVIPYHPGKLSSSSYTFYIADPSFRKKVSY